MRRAFRSLLPLATLLAGCAMPAPMAGPGTGNWVLDRQAEGPGAVAPPVAALPAPVVVPDVPAVPVDPAFAAIAESLALPLPAAEPARRSGGGGSSRAAAATSRLTVDLRGFLGGLAPLRARRLLAVADDVEKLVVTVYQPGQPEKVITVTKAQIAAGVAEVTFEELALGNAIVFAVAYDATDMPIGSAAQVVIVRADGPAMADLTMALVSSGGAGSGPAGTLVTRTTFLDGPIPDPPAGTILTEIRAWMGMPFDLEPAPNGEMIYGSNLYPDQTLGVARNIGGFARFAPDGTTSFSIGTLMYRGPLRIRADVADGAVWLMTPGRRLPAEQLVGKPAQNNLMLLGQALPYTATMGEVGPAGDLYYYLQNEAGRPIHRMSKAGVDTTTAMTGGGALAIGPGGEVWTNGAADPASATTAAAEAVRRYGPDGTLLATHPAPGPVIRLWAAPDGSAWLGHGPAATTVSSPTLGWDRRTATHLTHMAADGTVLATLALTHHDVALDADGNAWVTGPADLVRLSPAGAELGRWAFPAVAAATATDGTIWVAGQYGLIRRIQP